MIMNSIELTKKLIEIESTDPGAYEFEIEKFLKTYLDELKTYGVEVFESEVLDGRKNLMGVLRAAHAVRGDGVGAKQCEQSVGAKHREPEEVVSSTSESPSTSVHTKLPTEVRVLFAAFEVSPFKSFTYPTWLKNSATVELFR